MSNRLFVYIFIIFCCFGCATLNTYEYSKAIELEGYGVDSNSIEKKVVPAAAALNLLPGIGNFYLAYDSQENIQWFIGGVNFLLYPTSILWGVPQAAIDADTINTKETVRYYTYDPIGREELKRRQEMVFRDLYDSKNTETQIKSQYIKQNSFQDKRFDKVSNCD